VIWPSACEKLPDAFVLCPSACEVLPDASAPTPSVCEHEPDAVVVVPSAWDALPDAVVLYPSTWEFSPKAIPVMNNKLLFSSHSKFIDLSTVNVSLSSLIAVTFTNRFSPLFSILKTDPIVIVVYWVESKLIDVEPKSQLYPVNAAITPLPSA
jgi:hypothetical protein